ncbi:TerB N-terminal domain-containing protein [Sporanaerobacter acetigenes]|uniref:TerB N-terminal domain-containing protein n=1 Tax=Sporanaerobacter acetigenes TaxID=165813 RepID=UPI00331FF28C
MELLTSIKRVFYSPTIKKDLKSNIDPDIFNLLWFADGPYQNYDINEHIKTYEEGPITISFYTSHSFEPSVLYVSLPIKKPTDINKVDSPSYYPSYKNLDPEQRWIYLNWLIDPYKPIDIGYVFIFYYGLERHLVLGEFDKAFDVILKLRQTHNNNSFKYYSDNALVLSTILHNRPDKLKQYLECIGETECSSNTATYLLAKYTFKQKLNSQDIIQVSKSVGFTNHRYIKNEYALFKEVLEDNLTELFNEPFFPLENFNIKNCSKTDVFFLANYSFEPNQRTIPIPDLTQNKNFNESVYSILSVTHETVKKILREMRKKNKNVPAKQVNN